MEAKLIAITVGTSKQVAATSTRVDPCSCKSVSLAGWPKLSSQAFIDSVDGRYEEWS